MKIFSGIPSWESARKAMIEYSMLLRQHKVDDTEEETNKRMVDEYIALSKFVSSLFISDDGYVIDTGNFQNVNDTILEDIFTKARKHPILWRLFMVC